MKIWKCTFCWEFNWGHILKFFMTMTSLFWRDLYLEYSVLTSSFLLQLAKCWTLLRVMRNVNKFNKLASKVSSKFIETFRPIPSHAGQTAWDNWLLWSLHRSSKQHSDQVILYQQHFRDNEYTFCTKRVLLVSQNTCHTWMHFRLNKICAKFFCPPKTNNRTLLLKGYLKRKRCLIVIKLTTGIHN